MKFSLNYIRGKESSAIHALSSPLHHVVWRVDGDHFMETHLFGVWPNHCQDGYVGLPRSPAPAQMTSRSGGWGGRGPIPLPLSLGTNPVLITLPLSNSDGPVGVCAAYVPSLVSSSRWNYPLGETPEALLPTPPATAEEVSSEAPESHWLVPGV